MDVQNVVLITDRYMAMMIGQTFKIISGMAGLLMINWKLTLIVLAIVPVKYFTVRKLARRNEKKIEEYIETSRDFSAWFGDLIGGIYEIKLWNLYHAKDKDFSVKQNKVLKTEKDTTMIGAWNRFIEVLLEWGAIGLQYIMGGLLMISGELTIGGVFAFLSYSSYVTGPISFVMNMRFFFSRIIPSAKRLFKLLDAEEEKSGNDTVPYQEVKLGNFVIDFENVSFTYAGSAQRILNKINLSIEPGKKIAIIGANGSGKSTILNLLLRFTEPTGGKIKLCGKDIQTLNLAQYRAFFAVVSQEPYLFFDTIENNINLFGDADHAAINSAAKQSGAMGFIERLPEREKSMIGQNGAKLSGGEKQKLAVARAIIKDAPIIILDEATSGYDVESDKYLYRILEKELKNKTVIIITHRYDCLSEMDMVFKLEEGYLWRQFNNA